MIEAIVLSISAVVATRDRAGALRRTLQSLIDQGDLPAELIVIDGSKGMSSRQVLNAFSIPAQKHGCRTLWQPAKVTGAASQRNQGVEVATEPFIWFFDDDILLEPRCLSRLWQAMTSDVGLGGVSAMITNQRYQSPGLVSRIMFRIMAGQRLCSYAGRVLGPAVNLLPEDREDLPAVCPVDWLNTTCTLYRRLALPSPPFAGHFTGYSLMEDLALSLTVGRRWRLANVREARIRHESEGGAHKADHAEVHRMELVNRHYVMTRILGRSSFGDYVKLALWQSFGVVGSMINGRVPLQDILRGTWRGVRDIRRVTSEQ